MHRQKLKKSQLYIGASMATFIYLFFIFFVPLCLIQKGGIWEASAYTLIISFIYLVSFYFSTKEFKEEQKEEQKLKNDVSEDNSLYFSTKEKYM